MYVDDDEGHNADKDVDNNEKPNDDKNSGDNEKPNDDKDDHDDKVEKEAEERLAAAAAAEEGEGGGPPPPTKVKTRHAKKSEISPCLHFALEKKTLQICSKNSVKTKN